MRRWQTGRDDTARAGVRAYSVIDRHSRSLKGTGPKEVQMPKSSSKASAKAKSPPPDNSEATAFLNVPFAQGNHFMGHKCGFTLKVLFATLQANGFAVVSGKRRLAAFDLWAVAAKNAMADDEIRELATRYLPG